MLYSSTYLKSVHILYVLHHMYHLCLQPFIMDGFKFDLRIYVLVTSCDPLRVYVYKDGLGRFATIKYHEPTHHNLVCRQLLCVTTPQFCVCVSLQNEVCLHLTNYSINKSSDDFIRDDICGSKRRLSTVDQWFIDHGYDIKKIWSAIEVCYSWLCKLSHLMCPCN